MGLLEKFAAAPGGESFPSGLNGKVLVCLSDGAQRQSLCRTLGAGGPSMHGIAPRYS